MFSAVICALTFLSGVRARELSSTPAIDPLPDEMKPYTETIPGTNIHFDMVPIPGGTFKMGSPAEEPGRSGDEGPAHLVTIHPFWMGKMEVSWDEYDVFAFHAGITHIVGQPVEETPAEKLADAITHPTPPYTDETFGFGRHGQPAINITHHAAMEYTRWLSTLTGKDYRLATEAEWEYACRAGTETPYFFGSDAGKLGDYAWTMENSNSRPHPAGQKKPNPWGLDDILGNVGEWVLDRYDKDFYTTFKPDVPTLLPVLIPGKERFPNVVRGGSWDDKAGRARCATRQASTADWMSQDPQRPQSIWWLTDATFVGFRIVRPLEEQEDLKGLKSQVKKYDF